MTILTKLYRRGENFVKMANEVDVTAGVLYKWDFPYPGWIAFDYMANVPPKTGELAKKYLKVTVDGVTRFSVMGGWGWQRYYIFVDEGPHDVKFFVEGYEAGDYAKIRYIDLTEFPPCAEVEMLENVGVPKPLENINTFEVAQGWQRYQRSGNQGSEHTFTIIFTRLDRWEIFMKTLENFYIIKGPLGLYGGTIIPQDMESTRKGPLTLVTCKLKSPMRAGVGVKGI